MLPKDAELSILYEIASLSHRLRDVTSIVETSLDKATRLLGAEIAIFYLWDAKNQTLNAQNSIGIRLKQVAQTISLNDPDSLGQHAMLWTPAEPTALGITPLPEKYALQAALCVPVRTPTEFQAVLYVARVRTGEFNHTEIGLFNVLAEHVGGALEIVRARERDHEQQQALLASNAQLKRLVSDLSRSSHEQDLLLETIEQISTPVLALTNHILLAPIVGHVDSHRSQMLLDKLLQSVERQRAQVVILDITGVTIIDTQVANSIITASASAKLLGAKVILCGIVPDVAQVMVTLGIDLSSINTTSDLSQALRMAFHLDGKRIVARA